MHRARAMLPRPKGGVPPPAFVLTEDDLLAHVLFLQTAVTAIEPPPDSDPAASLAYLFEVEGTGGFLVTLHPAEGLAHVSPFADVPEDLKPDALAAMVQCSPVEMLTMLSGGAADLKVLQPTDLPALQRFLRSFDFGRYPAFCESRHLRAFNSSMTEAEQEELGVRVRKSMVEAQKSLDTMGLAVASSVRSVSQSVSQKLNSSAARKPPAQSLAAESAAQSAAEGSDTVGKVAAGASPRGEAEGQVAGEEAAAPPPSNEWREEALKEAQARATAALSSAKKGAALAGQRFSSAGAKLSERLAEARQSRGFGSGFGRRSAVDATGGGSSAAADSAAVSGAIGGVSAAEEGDGSLREEQLAELVDPLWQSALTAALAASEPAAQAATHAPAEAAAVAADGGGLVPPLTASVPPLTASVPPVTASVPPLTTPVTHSPSYAEAAHGAAQGEVALAEELLEEAETL